MKKFGGGGNKAPLPRSSPPLHILINDTISYWLVIGIDIGTGSEILHSTFILIFIFTIVGTLSFLTCTIELFPRIGSKLIQNKHKENQAKSISVVRVPIL